MAMIGSSTCTELKVMRGSAAVVALTFSAKGACGGAWVWLNRTGFVNASRERSKNKREIGMVNLECVYLAEAHACARHLAPGRERRECHSGVRWQLSCCSEEGQRTPVVVF